MNGWLARKKTRKVQKRMNDCLSEQMKEWNLLLMTKKRRQRIRRECKKRRKGKRKNEETLPELDERWMWCGDIRLKGLHIE